MNVSRTKTLNLITAASAMLALFMAGAPALGQAGSVGGNIGKQGKSASGSDNSPPPSTQPRQQRPNRNVATSSATTGSLRSLVGTWRWDAACTGGPGNGLFTLRETSPGEFSGAFGNTNSWDRGTISNGKFDGDSVTFESYYMYARTWTATVRGSRMQGSFSGGCTFTAVKQ